MGAAVDSALFADICLALEAAGAENVNIVTGSHAAAAIAEGLAAARERGLSIPALWNSSAYERVEAVDLAAGQVSVYLPDLKTLDPEISARYFKAPDYPEAATRAILRMAELRSLRYARARGPLAPGMAEDERPEVLVSGVVVRHLILPGHLDDTREVLRWFSENLAGRALISLMTQYTPVGAGAGVEMPGRFIDEREYDDALELLEEFGIDDGFYQELVLSDDWLPDFDRVNPFSSELSVPVWHWKDGFVR